VRETREAGSPVNLRNERGRHAQPTHSRSKGSLGFACEHNRRPSARDTRVVPCRQAVAVPWDRRAISFASVLAPRGFQLVVLRYVVPRYL